MQHRLIARFFQKPSGYEGFMTPMGAIKIWDTDGDLTQRFGPEEYSMSTFRNWQLNTWIRVKTTQNKHRNYVYQYIIIQKSLKASPATML